MVSSLDGRHPGESTGRLSALRLLVIFAVLGGVNVATLWWMYRTMQVSGAEVEVLEFSPGGEIGIDARISVLFSRPVVPDGAEIMPSTEGLLRFVPDVPGRLRWNGSRRLEFEPKSSLPRATRFQVSLSPRIGEAIGGTLVGERQFSFWTQALRLESARQIGFSSELQATIRLRFSDIVTPESLEEHLGLVTDGDRSVEYEILTKKRARQMDIKTVNSVERVVIRLSKGLRGAGGPLALGDVRLAVPLNYRLRLTKIESERVFRDQPRIFLTFTAAVSASTSGNLSKWVSVDPPVPLSVTTRSWRRQLVLSGPFQPGAKYRVTVKRGLASRGESVLTKDVVRELQIPDRRRELSFQPSSGYLSTEGSSRILVDSSGLARATIDAYRVPLNNLVHYLSFDRNWFDEHFLGEKHSIELAIAERHNQIAETSIDLHQMLGDDPQGIWYFTARARGLGTRDQLLVAATDIGLSAKRGESGIILWANSIAAGRSLAGAQARLMSYSNQIIAEAATDEHGIVHFPGPFAEEEGSRPYLAIVETKGDASYLLFDQSELAYVDFDTGGPAYLNRGYEAFLIRERGVCRPGDTLHIQGLVRDRYHQTPPTFPLELTVTRPGGKTLHTLTGELTPDGEIDFDISIPASARTGTYRVKLRIPGDGKHALGTTEFLVEDFVPDRIVARLSVALELANERHRCGDRVVLDLEARQLAGVPAAGADYELRWFATDRPFRPEGWDGFEFGEQSSQFRGGLAGGGLAGDGQSFDAREQRRQLTPRRGLANEGQLSDAGSARIPFELPEVGGSSPVEMRVTVKVFDTSGRTVDATTRLVVDPVDTYIGIKMRGSPRAGQSSDVDLAALFADARPVKNATLEVALYRLEWDSVLRQSASGQYRYESRRRRIEVSRQDASILDGKGRTRLTFANYGDYLLEVIDRTNGLRANREIRAAGGGWTSAPRLDSPEHLEIRWLTPVVRSGDRLQVEIRAPFPGTLLATIESDRVLSHQVVRLEQNNDIIEFTVPEGDWGQLYVTASLVRGTVSDTAGKSSLDKSSVNGEEASGDDGGERYRWAPHRAYGIRPFWIDRSPEELIVTIQGPDRVFPKSNLPLLVQVRGRDGDPRGDARVSLVVVDEGVLARTNHTTPDPWGYFYSKRSAGVVTSDVYSKLLPEIPFESAPSRPGGGQGAGTGGGANRLRSPIESRRYLTVTRWLGTYATDRDGRVMAHLQLPPFSGQLRVMAIAHDGALFGCSEMPVYVRGPLHMEIGMPRFLAPEDVMLTSVDLYSDDDEVRSAQLRWTIEGPLRLRESAQISPAQPSPASAENAAGVPVASAARPSVARAISSAETSTGTGLTRTRLDSTGVVEVRLSKAKPASHEFSWLAASAVGTVRATLEGTFGDYVATETIELPVRPAAAPLRKHSSGRVDASAALSLKIPDDCVRGTAKHRIVFSPLPGLDLLGSLSYLVDYPHGCLEQTTSRVFPLLHLQDLAALMQSTYVSGDSPLGEEAADIPRFVQAGIDRIIGMQSAEGWFASWPRGEHAWIWGSLYATHFLVEARRAEYPVDRAAVEAALSYLASLFELNRASPLELSYAAYILAVTGRDVGAEIESLLANDALARESRAKSRRSRLSTEARFLLGAAWLALGDEKRAARAIGGRLPAQESSASVAGTGPAGNRIAGASVSGGGVSGGGVSGGRVSGDGAVRDAGGSLRSPTRQDALLLATLIDIDPANADIPVLVERLKSARIDGRWATTQENAFALLALGKLAKLTRRKGSNYNAIVEVGGERVLLSALESKSFEGDFSGQTITAKIEGDGGLYWYLEEDGVPLDYQSGESDKGLRVRRSFYDALTGEPIPSSRGVHTVVQGQLVEARIEIEALRSLSNVVIVDLLPAGVEVENPRLRGGAKLAETAGEPPTELRLLEPNWVDLRDDRLLIYFDLKGRSRSHYRYLYRAVTRGRFALPAISAECLYLPEVSSRGGSGRLDVVDRS